MPSIGLKQEPSVYALILSICRGPGQRLSEDWTRKSDLEKGPGDHLLRSKEGNVSRLDYFSFPGHPY